MEPAPNNVPDLSGSPEDDRVSFHKNLLDSLFDGVYFVDTARKIVYWNQGSENLTGYSAPEALGRHCFENFLEHVDGKGHVLCADGCPLSKTMQDDKRIEGEVFFRHKQGYRVPISVRVAPIKDKSGTIVGAVEVFSDVTAKVKAERRAQELEGIAFQDSLTCLANRRHTELKVKQAIEEGQQFGRVFGLLMLDIDHFKQINDRYGHEAGDAVLKMVSGTLVKSLRDSDLVGRWGGEEFVVLLPGVSAPTLLELAERCRLLVQSSRVSMGGELVSVTISIGATRFLLGDSPASALKRADQLMYISKSGGRNQTTVG